MPPDWRILEGGVTETTRLDERQRFVPIRVVTYMVGTHGPFKVTLDAKDFTADKVTQLLDQAAAEIKRLYGP